jgi:CheY-like chemotaxis protein
MSDKLKCIMLVDDNPDDNFFHQRIINKFDSADEIILMESAKDALSYLTSELAKNEPCPDLIFLDINMPGMSGWEFLDEYEKLSHALRKPVIVVMLTSSDNSEDEAKARSRDIVSDFKTKPLTGLMLEAIFDKYFSSPNV